MRLAYRLSYLLFVASAHVAAWLAGRYRAAARANRLAPILVPLQLALLLAWFPARMVSLGTFEVCRMLAPRLLTAFPD